MRILARRAGLVGPEHVDPQASEPVRLPGARARAGRRARARRSATRSSMPWPGWHGSITAPTARARNTAAAPPTWSRWGWVITIAASAAALAAGVAGRRPPRAVPGRRASLPPASRAGSRRPGRRPGTTRGARPAAATSARAAPPSRAATEHGRERDATAAGRRHRGSRRERDQRGGRPERVARAPRRDLRVRQPADEPGAAGELGGGQPLSQRARAPRTGAPARAAADASPSPSSGARPTRQRVRRHVRAARPNWSQTIGAVRRRTQPRSRHVGAGGTG